MGQEEGEDRLPSPRMAGADKVASLCHMPGGVGGAWEGQGGQEVNGARRGKGRGLARF